MFKLVHGHVVNTVDWESDSVPRWSGFGDTDSSCTEDQKYTQELPSSVRQSYCHKCNINK